MFRNVSVKGTNLTDPSLRLKACTQRNMFCRNLNSSTVGAIKMNISKNTSFPRFSENNVKN